MVVTEGIFTDVNELVISSTFVRAAAVSLCLSSTVALSLDRLLLMMCDQSDRAVGRTLRECAEWSLYMYVKSLCYNINFVK